MLIDPATGRRPHPRTIGWVGTAALAMGGSNQSLFLIGALIAGQGDIPGQGSAAIPLLIVGLLLSYAAVPGWIELVLMSPNRVGGIAASCTAAFRPYSPILSALTGVCYWWGWVPTCGVTAIFSATAIGQWILPDVPVWLLACGLVALFTAVNLCGIKWATRLSIPIATASAGLAFISLLAPMLSGSVDWQRATDFSLTTPFSGRFGDMTSLMAGLYLIGFGAPAFEAATCHVAETIDCNRNIPRAVLASALMAGVYFALLPIVWFGALGAAPLSEDLNLSLGPVFAPLLGAFGKSAAIWFIMLNMFHGTIQPLAGAARTLSQLSDDGLLPRIVGERLASTDVPWVATLLTAGFAILFLLIGDPIWLIAAANFTYLIGIGLPSVAVWLLRRNEPGAARPWRAPRGTIGLGLAAACAWAITALFGFQQFGLPTVVIGLVLAYSGAALFALRRIEDRRRAGLRAFVPGLHAKLTGAMLLVLGLDAVGYIIAVGKIPQTDAPLIVALEDIFVAVAMLTITVGLVLPGMIAHAADQIGASARHLASGTLKDFSRAMLSLASGDLEGARIAIDIVPVEVKSRDEIGAMAESFNVLQTEVKTAALGLDGAREGLRTARRRLVEAKDAAESGNRSKAEFLAVMSHELRTPLNGVIGMAGLLLESELTTQSRQYAEALCDSADHLLRLINDVLDVTRLDAGQLSLERNELEIGSLVQGVIDLVTPAAKAKGVRVTASIGRDVPLFAVGDRDRLRQVLLNLVGNAVKFTKEGFVSVDVVRLPADEPHLRLVFEVRDTGIGISAEALPTLFREFSQVDTSISRRFGGTGLGLAICQKLAHLIGGTVDVTSEPGKGSVFRFSVSLAVSVRPGVPDLRSVRLDERTILVVDADAANRATFRRHIEERGGKVTDVALGEDALGILVAAATAGSPFQACIIDDAPPAVDGMILGRRIRIEPDLSGLQVILGTSPMPVAATRRAAEDVFDAVIVKPIAVSEFLRCLSLPPRHARRWLPEMMDRTKPNPPAEAKAGRALDILVAEDNATNQVVICAILNALGHRTDIVGNGREAVDAVKAKSYDVVVMDVMMPEMDGIEATRIIRSLPPPLGAIPILGLTANVSAEDHAAYRSAGMTDVISKPVAKPVFIAALDMIIAALEHGQADPALP